MWSRTADLSVAQAGQHEVESMLLLIVAYTVIGSMSVVTAQAAATARRLRQRFQRTRCLPHPGAPILQSGSISSRYCSQLHSYAASSAC
jgi:hypothetical protein